MYISHIIKKFLKLHESELNEIFLHLLRMLIYITKTEIWYTFQMLNNMCKEYSFNKKIFTICNINKNYLFQEKIYVAHFTKYFVHEHRKI